MGRKSNTQIAQPSMAGRSESAAWSYLFLAWVVALVASLSVLFVGEVMGQVPCVLCWYQRMFMFPLAIVLGVATYQSDYDVWRYAVPLAGFGALIALYHSLLYAGLISEGLAPCQRGISCTSADMTVFGFLPLPVVSLGSFIAIAFLILVVKRKTAP